MSSFKNCVAMILISIVGAILAIVLFGQYTTNLLVFELQLELGLLEPGYTKINIPPIGEIKAATHYSPFELNVLITSINLDSLKKITEQPLNFNIFYDNIIIIKRVFIIKNLILSFIGGAIFCFIFYSKNLNKIIISGTISVLIISLLLVMSFSTFDINAFLDSEYTGILEAAPWLISLLEESYHRIDEFSKLMELMASNIYGIFERLDHLEPFGINEESYKILHISDIHNNILSIDFVSQIVKRFNVDLIIDTGDITDYGTQVESILLDKISDLNIPYIFIPGNHDSPDVVEFMENLENVFVLDGEFITINNINIYGKADPSSTSYEIRPKETFALKENIQNIRKDINEIDAVIDIIAVHNHHIAESLSGLAPLILHGHTHSLDINKIGNSVIINSGTAGAAGIRGLQTNPEIPYTMVLIYLDLDYNKEMSLTAIDIMSFYNIQRGISIERKWFNHIF